MVNDIPKATNYNFTKADGMFGRYVLIKKQISYEDLYLSEVVVISESKTMIFNSINNDTISQNNDYSSNFVAKNAMDGKLDTCSYTGQMDPKSRNITGILAINLARSYMVYGFNIIDYYNEHNLARGNYEILVGTNNVCYYNITNKMNTYFVECAEQVIGQYIQFKKLYDYVQNRQDNLLFCEIDVYVKHDAQLFTYPINYTSTTTTTTMSTKTNLIPSTTTTILSFISQQYYSKINIPVTNVNQSHTFNQQEASLAIDNDPNTCSFTAQNEESMRNQVGWWKADLGRMYEVSYLKINDRQSSIPGFFDIYIDKNYSSLNHICITFDRTTNPSNVLNYTCQQVVVGQYMTIIKIHDRIREDALGLCEVEVYGKLSNSNPSTVPNILTGLNNTGIIVGCVVGILGVIIFAVVAFLLYRRFTIKCDNNLIKGQRLPADMKQMSDDLFLHTRDKGKNIGVANPLMDISASTSKDRVVAQLIMSKMKATSEFKKLLNEKVKSASIAASQQNWQKNRFKNICPFDDDLVTLDVEDGDSSTDDFINASFIQGYGGVDRKYIATQSPLPGTVRDMWRLVWQYDITTIVMLTKLEETNKKSEIYWPSSGQKTMNLETISVSLVVEETYADYVCRQLMLQDTRFDEPARMVRHLQFTSWTDKKRPDECFPLLAFRKRVNRFNEGSKSPLLVHCSAGVGRTGTYIAIDYLLEAAGVEQQVSVFQCVNSLRLQRMYMVQTEAQYEFIYDALIDGVKFSGCGIATKDYSERYTDLSAGTFMPNQFELLNSVRNYDGSSAGRNGKNNSKNREKTIFAYDHCRPLLPTIYSNRSDYINAVFVDSYREKNAYIVAQHPLVNTVEDFWTLVYQQEVQHIVMLDHQQHMQQMDLPYYWPNEVKKQEIGPYAVEIISTKKKKVPTATLR